ncbi:MAG: hypothetical protein ACP5H2_09710 [Solirubrobacteraceae bacterium]
MHDSAPQEPIDYRVIAETVPAIVFVSETGPQSRWLYVSEWIEPILGFTHRQGVDRSARDVGAPAAPRRPGH